MDRSRFARRFEEAVRRIFYRLILQPGYGETTPAEPGRESTQPSQAGLAWDGKRPEDPASILANQCKRAFLVRYRGGNEEGGGGSLKKISNAPSGKATKAWVGPIIAPPASKKGAANPKRVSPGAGSEERLKSQQVVSEKSWQKSVGPDAGGTPPWPVDSAPGGQSAQQGAGQAVPIGKAPAERGITVSASRMKTTKARRIGTRKWQGALFIMIPILLCNSQGAVNKKNHPSAGSGSFPPHPGKVPVFTIFPPVTIVAKQIRRTCRGRKSGRRPYSTEGKDLENALRFQRGRCV
mgnify:CR=1 FL=1